MQHPAKSIGLLKKGQELLFFLLLLVNTNLQILSALLHNEKELLQRTAEGDEAAFSVIFNTFRNKIYTVAYKLTESQTYAEEILQDVFLKVWLKRNNLIEINDFASWLFIITRNHTFSYLKKIATSEKRNTISLQNLPVIDLPADSLLIDKDYQVILLEAIDKLTPQQKQVFRLCRTEGLKREEIAERLGISPETVKIHLAHALKNVRAYCMARLGFPFIL